MFDLAWSEIALIVVVAVVVIGPKELPRAIQGIAGFIRKARQMAGEFQVHVDDMMRETKLDEVKKQIDEVRTGIYDVRRQVADAVDGDGKIKDAFKDPFVTPPPSYAPPGAVPPAGAVTQAADASVVTAPDAAHAAPDPVPAAADPVPASLDPAPASLDPAPASLDPVPAAVASDDPPAFVPPGTTKRDVV